MNPAPDTPDKDDHMIIPEIYESEPGFLTQAAMTTLITRLNDKIEELAMNQAKMDKIINDLLNTVNNNAKPRQTDNNLVSTPPLNSQDQETSPLCFAVIAAKTLKTTGPTLC
ncbi:hypothetical protein O181_074871 [Austropuccinia psidii MF-1]|uniref:Uncharacterized protein n=1 Tax=Austropuccinia psidii MF-1 TaxID=1389203 RepID=A0A9Q3F7E4_9BASI|nr:hypothetical protein [Austropuccinia psidii MF-1]